MPFSVWLSSIPANAARKMPAKAVHPFADRFPADTNPPLRKEIFNICCNQRKPMIGPNRVRNDRPWKAEALKPPEIETLKYLNVLKSPSGSIKLAIPTEHMDTPDRCLSLQKSSCAWGGVHTWLNGQIIAHLAGAGAVHSIRSDALPWQFHNEDWVENMKNTA